MSLQFTGATHAMDKLFRGISPRYLTDTAMLPIDSLPLLLEGREDAREVANGHEDQVDGDERKETS